MRVGVMHQQKVDAQPYTATSVTAELLFCIHTLGVWEFRLGGLYTAKYILTCAYCSVALVR